eukprot:5996936-Lingulodinium_polyedra.AAC.1
MAAFAKALRTIKMKHEGCWFPGRGSESALIQMPGGAAQECTSLLDDGGSDKMRGRALDHDQL